MSGRWWRAYDRSRHNPKLLKLSDRHFRWWFNLVCAASEKGGVLPPHADLAAEFRVSGKVMTDILDALIAAELFDHDETGIRPHDWDELQYKSDSSSNRVKAFRKRQGNGACNVSETPSESETDTDTDKTGAKAPEEPRNEPRTKLPADWQPSPDCRDHARDKGLDPNSTSEAFTDYFTQGRGRNEKRTAAGWEKRFRVWCNTDADRRPARGIRPAAPGGDAAAFARAADRLGRG